jgi:UDP-glucuronate 4-epimerase
MKILITGVAGFIGYHLANKLLKTSNKIYGIDHLNNYYSSKLKKDRLKELKKNKNKLTFYKKDISNKKFVDKIFKLEKFDVIINLAAQAGVRYSITNPDSYIKRNIIGFYNILEASRMNNIKHLIYASTSSVYGDNKQFPLTEKLFTNKPLTLYAATKLSNELMAHAYSYLFKIKTTGLRFFTVYGPWGRPDMALFLFTKNIIANKPINVFNNGNHIRDFTYVEDIAEGIKKIVLSKKKTKEKYNIFNIGNDKPIHLIEYINQIEKCLDKKAKKINLPLQQGDIVKTHASIKKIKKYYNFKPVTNVEKGISNFINWYKSYFSN